MPELTTFNWIVICVVMTTLSGLAAFFLKNLFTKHDNHGNAIQDIHKEYPSRDELNSAASALRGEQKLMNEKLDAHGRDINEIKRTYVTRDELKEIRGELRNETRVLSADVSEIKHNYLTKDEYLRRQVETDRKLDRIMEFLLTERGGSGNGQ